MSPTGELNTTEPVLFEVVASVQIGKAVEIFVVNHEH